MTGFAGGIVPSASPATGRRTLIAVFCVLATSVLPAWAQGGDAAQDVRPSVLFVNVDDWNDWNQVLRGHPQAITPHIERLARQGVTFSNAICPSPVCFPSRTAIFSGVHPARAPSRAIAPVVWRGSTR